MKFLIVFVLVAVAVGNIRAEFTKEDAIAIATACKEEAGASDADFEAMMKHEPADTTEGKCMLACGLKKFGVMNDEGKLVKEKAVEIAEIFIKDEDKKELFVEVTEACESLEVNDDHCEAASEYGQCLKTESEARHLSFAEF